MKKIISIFILIFIIMPFSGCMQRAKVSSENTKIYPGSTHANQGITYNKINFTVITDYSTLPNNIQTFIQNNRAQRGYKAFKADDNSYIIFISSGQRSSGGYGITVKSVEDIEGKTKIVVEETAPKPEDMVIMALTYPSVVIRVRGIAPNFDVRDVHGKAFEEIQMEQR